MKPLLELAPEMATFSEKKIINNIKYKFSGPPCQKLQHKFRTRIFSELSLYLIYVAVGVAKNATF